MQPNEHSGDLSQEKIKQEIVAILEDMTLDWDMDLDASIDAETRLIADLAFESVDVVQFVVAIEEQFRCRGLPWEEFLMVNGSYVDEITVGEAADFLCHSLDNRLKGDVDESNPADRT